MIEPPQNAEKSPKLENITRVILLICILFVSGAIIYVSTRPKETDIFFFLLNEDKLMQDYPTEVNVGEPVILFTYIENLSGISKIFQVRVYCTPDSTMINSSIGVSNLIEADYQYNQTSELENGETWISNPMQLIFNEMNSQKIIIFELWQYENNNWEYIPDYLLTLRIAINE